MDHWPDGGIGRIHKHPFWSKCAHCGAASGLLQMVVDLAVVMFFVGCFWYLAAKVLEAFVNIY